MKTRDMEITHVFGLIGHLRDRTRRVTVGMQCLCHQGVEKRASEPRLTSGTDPQASDISDTWN